jgi:preprotein translocase subunit SecE
MAVQARKRTEPTPEWGPARFLRETIDELRKVVWPTLPELYRYTLVVVATVVVIATFIGLVDFGVEQFVKRFIYAAVSK